MSNRSLLGAIGAVLLLGVLCVCTVGAFLVARTSNGAPALSEELPSISGEAPVDSDLGEAQPVMPETQADGEAPLDEIDVESQEELVALLSAEAELLNAVYERVNQSVVNISVSGSDESLAGDLGEGSGWVWDDQGHIVTNNHVVESARTVFVTLPDGRRFTAEVVGTDFDSDLAVIRVEEGVALEPLVLGDSDELRVGERVIAIGNPFGFDGTMTLGVVSGTGRTVPGRVAENGSIYNLPNLVQTDAAINPGNSGGPLLDIEGRVIGVNTLIYSQNAFANSGVGFAIPVNKVRAVVPDLISTGSYETPFIGLGGPVSLTPELAEELELEGVSSGVLFIEVVEDGPAARAGLRGGDREVFLPGVGTILAGGDVVTAIDGQPVADFDDLINYLDTRSVGDEVTVSIVRDGEPQEVVVTLGARP